MWQIKSFCFSFKFNLHPKFTLRMYVHDLNCSNFLWIFLMFIIIRKLCKQIIINKFIETCLYILNIYLCVIVIVPHIEISNQSTSFEYILNKKQNLCMVERKKAISFLYIYNTYMKWIHSKGRKEREKRIYVSCRWRPHMNWCCYL